MRAAARRPVYVFDPQDLVPEAEKLRWNPVKGCEVPQKAILRARGFAGFAGVGPALDGGGDYWEQVAASIIRSYLHAAALGGLGVEDLLDWSRRPEAQEPGPDPHAPSNAAPGWDEDLPHRRTWSHVIGTPSGPRFAGRSTASADPKVLEATRVDQDTFDPTRSWPQSEPST